MAQQLGSMAVGSIVKIRESTGLADYVIADQNFLDGAGSWGNYVYQNTAGTWLLRRESAGETPWDASDNLNYVGSDLDKFCTSFYEQKLSGIASKVKQVGIPDVTDYRPEEEQYNIIKRYAFPPARWELTDYLAIGGNPDVAKLLKVVSFFTRESSTRAGSGAHVTTRYGSASNLVYSGTNPVYGDLVSLTASANVQILIVLDPSTTVSDDGTILGYYVDTFNVPDTAMTGQAIPISWSAAEEATTYVLERKADTDEDWVQLYSGANLSYTDTAGSWTSVQYRVKAGAGSDFGDYTTSKSIPVVSASALVISGEDENLGTITGDLTYTIISDTGNPITLERRVNGKLVAKGTVNSGFSYPISVFDLPTGAGTIELSASVTSGSAPVTATRTWTYTKTPVTFPEEGGPAQLTQGGQNVFPATIAEAVRTTTALGGTLDKTLELLTPLLNSAVISVGTYTGTGTFGADNPSTLTFDSAPSIVTIYGGGKTLAISSTDTEGTAYIDGTSAKWYADTAENQLNVSGTTYSYIAIGEVTES